jgi:hypothetical protein
MANEFETADIAADIIAGGNAMGRLAANSDIFGEAIKAFRSHDGDAWNKMLTKAQLNVSCHWICDWVCSKECVRLCILLAGPPREPITVEQIGPFTAALTRLAEQPKAIELLVRAIEGEDSAAFQKIAADIGAKASVSFGVSWSAASCASCKNGTWPI